MADSASRDPARNNEAVVKLKRIITNFVDELRKPSESTQVLLKKLDDLEYVLSRLEDGHLKLVGEELQLSKEVLIADNLLKHSELDVRLSTASCVGEIIKLSPPDQPFNDDQMKVFFQLANVAYKNLPCMTGLAYSKALSILQAVSKTQACVLMLDLELYRVVHIMFHLFLNGIRTNHPEATFSNMENIMTSIIHNNNDCDEFSVELLTVLLPSLKKENHGISPSAFNLAKKVFENCANDLKTHLPRAIRCLRYSVEEYDEVVASILTTQPENVDNTEIRGDASHHDREVGQSIDGGLSEQAEDNTAVVLDNASHTQPDFESEALISMKSGAAIVQVSNLQHQKKHAEINEEIQRNSEESTRIANEVAPAETGMKSINTAEDLSGDILIKTLASGSRKRSLKENPHTGKASNRRDRREIMTHERKDPMKIGLDVSRRGEVGQEMHDGSSMPTNDTKNTDLKDNENLEENQGAMPKLDKPENVNPEDAPRKRIWKPKYATKPGEGYEDLWIFRRNKRKRIGDSVNNMMSRDSHSSSRPVEEHLNSQETDKINKHAGEGMEPSTKKKSTKRKKLLIDVAPIEKEPDKITDEDLTDDILIKNLATNSRTRPLKKEKTAGESLKRTTKDGIHDI